MFAVTQGCAVLGTESVPVRVESSLDDGLPHFTIVGMRESEGREARERIRCALASIGVKFPLKRVTINLAPADIPKTGAAFDVPIAIALLASLGVIPAERAARTGSYGELSLDGRVRAVPGAIAASLLGGRSSWEQFLVSESVSGAAAHARLPVFGARHLRELVHHLRQVRPLEQSRPTALQSTFPDLPELSDVHGQEQAVRATEVAAAGGHNFLMFGPPGCGKTMLAARLPGLLPVLDGEEALEVATIHDAAGLSRELTVSRPFRAPHHSCSMQALIGGGSVRPVVGEITLAHRGVLFLDELPEFRPTAIDSLRQPLEARAVVLRRAQWAVCYPADTQLVAAMNLCRCGRDGAKRGAACRCSPVSKESYRRRISGAMVDRFDLRLRLDPPESHALSLKRAPASEVVRERVAAARARQLARHGRLNAALRDVPVSALGLEASAQRLLERVADKRGMSARAQQSLARVARTIADLQAVRHVTAAHLGEAAGFCAMPWGGDDEHD